MTLALRAFAVRRASIAVPCVAALAAAMLTATAQGGAVDAVGLEFQGVIGKTVAISAAVFEAGPSGMGGVASAGGSAVGGTLPAAIGTAAPVGEFLGEASRGSRDDWQSRLKAAGYAETPAFGEERERAAAADVPTLAAEGGGEAAAWSDDGPVQHGNRADDEEHSTLPDWSRRLRLGVRTAAFTFYLSPSIPDATRAAY